ncbi:hypothetical protein LSTR_LSTR008198 [Laodelphax striatellus]|uniref:NOT2/NOT3/NOT5 C-terminal domain-containing protein n=1 Tax=Laodelphax striatellus TaxID=195883 RepID=A0A482WJX0_LAOST|nr:hypothetical protein LSTR_LSTR008198 [Laodelphax striatellus]
MANLNFQQPPRSLASHSQGGAARGFGGGGGHVTPTFPGGGGGVVGGSTAPQQLSPNRSQQLVGAVPPPSARGGTAGGGGSIFAPRSFPADRRPVPGGLGSVMPDWSSSSLGNMGSFGMPPSRSSYNSNSSGQGGGGQQAVGGNNSFHSVFGGGGDSGSTPPVLDLSEFPSLTNRGGGGAGGGGLGGGTGGGQGDSMPPQATTMPGKQPYVGMVKQPTSESSEFTMSNEDFPALPGTSAVGGPTAAASGGGGAPGAAAGVGAADGAGTQALAVDKGGVSEGLGGGGAMGVDAMVVGGGNRERMTTPHDKSTLQHKRGIQTSPDGKVTNIPASMVKDQFGMVGLLTFIRAAETDPNLVSLALGQDLTALGLNLNSPDNLYPTFGGPWADMPCRPQDIDCLVPPEYLINHGIREKLAQIKLGRYKDDVLFYMFYTNVGDFLQLAAAAELYQREWRYHMEEKVWITQAPGLGAVEKTSTYERGTYYFFDAQNWRKVPKDFHLEYSKLENRPILPSSNLPLQQPV